jgi:putative hydrolase of the HAD superfamily
VPRTSTAKQAVLLDALGTLVELEPPAPYLVAELSRRCGVEVPLGAAEAGIAAEIAYYKEHHLEGRDPSSLADLRRRCAATLLAALPSPARERLDLDELVAALLASLHFRAYPEVAGWLTVLRAAGLKLAVVSNWDVSLAEALERVGLAPLLDCVVTSAEAGAAKPDPAVFRLALERLGVPPERAIHLGDTPDLDLVGAEAAGIEAVLVRRP